MTRVMLPLAEGVEEVEAISVVDTLRRAGWDVVVAGLCDGPVTASRGVKIVPDQLLDTLDSESFDLLVIPGGGGGTKRLMQDERVLRWVRDFYQKGKWIAAICAGPKVLYTAGILNGCRVTCYPGVEREMPGIIHDADAVVVDGKTVTSQGVGTALLFALKLVALIDGEMASEELAAQMVV